MIKKGQLRKSVPFYPNLQAFAEHVETSDQEAQEVIPQVHSALNLRKHVGFIRTRNHSNRMQHLRTEADAYEGPANAYTDNT